MNPTRKSAEGRISEETDNSVNSYVIELMERQSNDRNSAERQGSPFASLDVQTTPMPRDSLEQCTVRTTSERSPPLLSRVDEHLPSRSLQSQPSPGTRMATFKNYREQIGTRSAMSLDAPDARSFLRAQQDPSNELRISMDLPANISTQLNHPSDEVVRARLVKHRRRLPIKWVIGFGIVSSCCLLIGLATLSIGLFNFSKLRQNRAQKSIQGLEDDLAPTFNEINKNLAAVQLGLALALGRPGGPIAPP